MSIRVMLQRLLCSAAAVTVIACSIQAQAEKEYPPFDKVSDGYRKVISTADGQPSLYTLYRNDKENQILAELPRNYEGKRVYIAVSIAGGSSYTGWQWSDIYAYWREVNNQLVLMQPELQYQALSEPEIQSSVKRTYTDKVLLSVPIVTKGPGGGPVIDFDSLLVGHSSQFALPLNPKLTTVKECKAFPHNLEITFEGPGDDGRLTEIHYSISEFPKTDYKPRKADERVGYFMTVFKDFSKDSDDGKQFVRYINRWNVKKRDPSLDLSPPEQPIVFYIEHTVPVKYRRFVRDGILEWNKAFEQIGIDGAIEVRQQDAKTGAYMDFDPEDVRYNFIRWITSQQAFAMGPSRANPETGEIMDADIIFDDSMIRYYGLDYQRMIAELPKKDASSEELNWIKSHPDWDPETYLPHIDQTVLDGPSGLPQGDAGVMFRRDDSNPGTLLDRVVQRNRRCDLAIGMVEQMNMARLALDPSQNADQPEIDGIPVKFVSEILQEIVCHEVGHTLGLRHNFIASTWKSLKDMNAQVGEAQDGSVMDYNPINIAPPGTPQGDWMTPTIGPYDYWAIKYGYTFDDSKLTDIASECTKSGLAYATDEDAAGPDPRVRRFDMGKDPIDYANREVDQVVRLRGQLLDRAVKKGEPWYPARMFFGMLLNQQADACNMMARFVGGTYVSRARKGDPDAPPPMTPVEAKKQRDAMDFIIKWAFRDDAYGLDPKLLEYLATDKQSHWGNESGPPELQVHQIVMNIQSGVILQLMNPTVLRRIYDNEWLVPQDQDAYTLPEHMSKLSTAIWSEVLDAKLDAGRKYDNRNPMISSLRRNLQRTYVSRLIDLSQTTDASSASQPVQALSLEWMVKLQKDIDKLLGDANAGTIDDYTRSHLAECSRRLKAAIDKVDTYKND